MSVTALRPRRHATHLRGPWAASRPIAPTISSASSWRRRPLPRPTSMKGTCPMAATRLSTQRLKRKVLHVCSDARFLGDEIVRLVNEAKDPRQALQLAARAHQIAVEAVSPKIFGHGFPAPEGQEVRALQVRQPLAR